jgi:D-serine deaminase-like pyridoxal phosphate-dependent protein
LARRQIEAGSAVGITCAKLGEAEVMADAGVRDILIANEVVGPIKTGRLTELALRCDLMVAVDDPANVAMLSQACQARGASVRILVELNVGMNRCGVQPGAAALELARRIAESPGLRFRGLMGYEGHLVGTKDPLERAARVREAFRPLQETCELLERAGLAVPIVSGGGTGTYDVTGTLDRVTEVQAGSYVFMDTTYLKVRPEFQSALTVLSSVVSRPVPERVVVDAGMKTMTREFGWPEVLGMGSLTVRSLSEEHATLEVSEPQNVRLSPGDRVRFIPSHCCTTVNLHDTLHVVQGDLLVDIWPIAARGAAQ